MVPRALIVEDDKSSLESLAEWVEAQGFTVSTASSLEQARKETSGRSFDIALVDLQLPDGSGTDPADVSKLLKEFSAMSGMMQQMAGMSKWQQMRQIKQMADGGLFNPGAQIQVQKQRSARGPLDKKALQDKKKKQRKEAKKQRKKNRR